MYYTTKEALRIAAVLVLHLREAEVRPRFFLACTLPLAANFAIAPVGVDFEACPPSVSETSYYGPPKIPIFRPLRRGPSPEFPTFLRLDLCRTSLTTTNTTNITITAAQERSSCPNSKHKYPKSMLLTQARCFSAESDGTLQCHDNDIHWCR